MNITYEEAKLVKSLIEASGYEWMVVVKKLAAKIDQHLGSKDG